MFKNTKKDDLQENEQIKFHSLAPTDNADITTYRQALDWAIKEPKVNNIALTGNYGSGKSSIISTYQKESKNSKRFLNISLASFQKDSFEEDGMVIEKSILQQLFYSEKEKKIPLSRFKKINNINKSLWIKLLCILVLIISIIWYINPQYLINIKDFIWERFSYNYNFFPDYTIINCILNKLTKATIGAISLAFSIYILNLIYKLIINISYKFVIKKESFEIEITQKDKEQNESIFNKYIDEIIYFFEVTEYDTVIFEDLDRIEDYESLFIKLRELNTLLNNSKIIEKKKITFIYAVKDDIFNNSKDRAKFFEFIIPIIPIINSSNSKDKMIELLENNKYKNDLLEANFLSNIMLYVDDMRVLNSIINEFNIYSQKIIVNINAKELFSIIVYKNLFPSDFSMLQLDKGILYEILNNKKENLKDILSELNNRKSVLQKEIENIENILNVSSIEEYKRYIWTFLIQKYSNNFYINGKRYSSYEIDNFLQNEETSSVDVLKNLKVSSSYGVPIKITEIIANLEEKMKVSEEEITDLLKQKNEEYLNVDKEIAIIEQKNVGNIIKEYGIQKYYNLPEEMKILIFLLQNGYITENYRECINYFYSSTLKIEDKNFILNVNSQIAMDYGYKLSNMTNILEYIELNVFNKEEILNFDLLEFMLNNCSKYNLQLEKIFNQFNNETFDWEFLKGFFINKKITGKFARYYIKYCDEKFFNLIEKLTNIQKIKLLNRVLSYADIEDIEVAFSNNARFIKLVNENKYFLRIFKNNIERGEKILKLLNVKLCALDTKLLNSEIFNIVYKNNNYEINIINIEKILSEKFNKDVNYINTMNYSTILENEIMTKYIDNNLKLYLDNVFFKLETNKSENANAINKILSSVILDETYIEKIINQENEIDNITQINDRLIKEEDVEITSIWKIYLKNNKVKPLFNNLLEYFNKYALDELLIDFLNKNEMNLEKDIHLEFQKYKTFVDSIIKNDKINLNIFKHILSLNGAYIYNVFDFSNINGNRTKEILLSKKIQIKFNTNNYNNIKENHPQLLSLYVKKNIEEFYKNMDDLEYTVQVIIDIISDSNIIRAKKARILSKCDNRLDIITIEEKKKIIDFILKGRNALELKFDFFVKLIDENINLHDFIALIEFQNSKLDNEEFSQCLSYYKEPYNNIPGKDRNPRLEVNWLNTKLVELINARKLNYISSITTPGNKNEYWINKCKK